MNCDCITTEEKRISAGFFDGTLEKPKKAGRTEYVRCDSTGLSMKSGKHVLLIGFNAHFEGVKKPMPVRIKAEYCPFCGGKYE